MQILLATDEAERRGDAGEALAIMRNDLLDDDGRPFWRPERLRRLWQVSLLGTSLPSWARSRWVLMQAAQALDHTTRTGHQRPVELAIARRGVSDATRRAQEAGDPDVLRTTVTDHDWIHRQLTLYEFGGLTRFLRRSATPALLAGADRMDDWAVARMGGHLVLGQSSHAIEWLDLGTDEVFSTPNIGSAVLLLEGDHVVGRRVEARTGAFFESAPLRVPPQAAADVAADPPGWLDVVSRWTSSAVSEGQRVMTGGHTFELLTDVPTGVLSLCCIDAGGPVALVRTALDDAVPDEPDAVPDAPLVAACLADPGVLAALTRSMSRADLHRLVAYAEAKLPEPASSLAAAGLADDLRLAS